MLLAIMPGMLAASASAGGKFTESQNLLLQPETCIALNKGDQCYQEINVVWYSTQVGNYCLHTGNSSLPTYCWKAADHGSFKLEFKSDTDVEYRLINRDTNQVIRTRKVSVAWVYRSNQKKRSSWRLF